MNLIDKIYKEFQFEVVVGVELEFYLKNFTYDKFQLFSQEMAQEKRLLSIEKEDGDNQFEIKIKHSNDLTHLIQTINYLKQRITYVAKKNQMVANFAGKPYDDQPGSAMHFHINLLNQGVNLFMKGSDNNESQWLLYSIGGLCRTMKQSISYFVPNKNSYKRIQYNDINTPCSVSWGGNNRTTAIRIPNSTNISRRIEYRVCSADADPAIALYHIIKGIYLGIANKYLPPVKIYGNASDRQYNAEKFPHDYKAFKYITTNNFF